MKGERRVESFAIEICRDEARRLLGMRRRRKRPMRESLLRCFEEEYALAHDLVASRAVWMTSQGLAGSNHVEPRVPVALAVCTIGVALEERVSRLAESGQGVRAMILDAIGSAAVETVADRSNGRICAWAISEGLAPGVRSSPGYRGWDVREQRLIFDLLLPKDIGVMLNSSCMMLPNKSISFLVPVGGAEEERSGGRCSRCGFEDCEYREHSRS